MTDSIECQRARMKVASFKKSAKEMGKVIVVFIGVVGFLLWYPSLIAGVLWAKVVGIVIVSLIGLVVTCAILCALWLWVKELREVFRAYRLVKRCEKE